MRKLGGSSKLPRPRRGRTRATAHKVRGRGTDEAIEDGPPRLVSPHADRVYEAGRSRKRQHPGTKRLRSRLRAKLAGLRRMPLGPGGKAFTNA